jgi:Tol biopolymer transport system component
VQTAASSHFRSLAENLVPGDRGCVEPLNQIPVLHCTRVYVRDRFLGTTEPVSLSTPGVPPNGSSGAPSISAEGRFVAFSSRAANLVPGDTNEAEDAFVRDRLARSTERVSVGRDGAQAYGKDPYYLSAAPSISGDGRYVAFASAASNLVAGDTNDSADVFVRDRLAGRTERVSVSGDGAQADAVSDYMAISADGRSVVFRSIATNLVPNDVNYLWDVFVRDRVAGTTELVSVSSSGEQANFYSVGVSINADGRSSRSARMRRIWSLTTRTSAPRRRPGSAARTCSCATGCVARPSG